MKVILVGGVAGGATAAARIRRLDEQAQILIFERSGYVSYANCGLPYYIGGVITDQAELTLQTPEHFYARYRVDVRVRHEVLSIDPAHKTVRVRKLDTGEEWDETYDRLLLSPGARPTMPRADVAEDEAVFTLRTLEDTLRITRFLDEHSPRSVVLAGGGYIGVELAENLAARGLSVTLVQRPRQLLTPLDYDMACFVHAQLRSKGVRLLLGRTVTGVTRENGVLTVHLQDAPSLQTDMAVLALGVTPDTKLAADAGLKLGLKGSIVVNEHMQTSAPDVYAVGDAVEIRSSVSGLPACIPLAGPANKQGRIAADNICGRPSVFKGAQGTSIVQAFGLTAAATGLNEKTARAAGIAFDRVVLSPLSHAGYYPGAAVMTMKVLFEPETLRLLGAQIVGTQGVDKRIDVLAAAIHAGMTGPELAELDLAYAPPYGSAKDPVNMAGYLIDNLAAGTVKQIHWDELETLPRDGSVTLLDVRTPGEYAGGCAEGFRNIPVDELRERIGELDPSKPVCVMCQSALRSYIACRILTQHGFACRNFSGGYRFYRTVVQERAAAEHALPCGMET